QSPMRLVMASTRARLLRRIPEFMSRLELRSLQGSMLPQRLGHRDSRGFLRADPARYGCVGLRALPPYGRPPRPAENAGGAVPSRRAALPDGASVVGALAQA